jgi:hypothetical protein
VSDDQTFRAIWLISLLLMVLAATVPMVRSRRNWLRQAAIWILTLGFLLAFYRIAQWLVA